MNDSTANVAAEIAVGVSLVIKASAIMAAKPKKDIVNAANAANEMVFMLLC